MKHFSLRQYPTEKISHRVLYVLTAVIVVMFCLFYFVGYDHPFDENPEYNAPQFTGVLVGFIIFFVVASVVVGLASLFISLRKRGDDGSVVNGIPVRRIAVGVTTFTILLMAVTFMFGSSDAVDINGDKYQNVFWLKVADMFVNSVLVMLVLSVAAVVFGATRYLRKKDRKC